MESLIERAKQRLAQFRAGNLSARVAKEFTNPADLSAGLGHSESEICPACGSNGWLEGSTVESSEVQSSQVTEEDYV